MKGDSILLFLILFPMAGAALAYLIGRKNKKARDITAVCVAAVEFMIAAVLLGGVCQDKTYSFYLPDFCLYILLSCFCSFVLIVQI